DQGLKETERQEPEQRVGDREQPVQQWQPGKRLDRVLEGARHREEGGDARWGLMVDLEDELDADRVTGEGGLLDAGVVEHLDEVGGDALERDVLGAKARGVEAGRTGQSRLPVAAGVDEQSRVAGLDQYR